jgi:hypothetical protein
VRRVHTRAGMQDAATVWDAAHGHQQGTLGRRGRRTAMPPNPRAVCGETSGGAGDGRGVVPLHGSGRRRGGNARGAVRRRTRRRVERPPGGDDVQCAANGLAVGPQSAALAERLFTSLCGARWSEPEGPQRVLTLADGTGAQSRTGSTGDSDITTYRPPYPRWKRARSGGHLLMSALASRLSGGLLAVRPRARGPHPVDQVAEPGLGGGAAPPTPSHLAVLSFSSLKYALVYCTYV